MYSRIQAVNNGTEYVIASKPYTYTIEARELPSSDYSATFMKNSNMFQKNASSNPDEFLILVTTNVSIKIMVCSKENLTEHRVVVTKSDLKGHQLNKFDCVINTKRLFSLFE